MESSHDELGTNHSSQEPKGPEEPRKARIIRGPAGDLIRAITAIHNAVIDLKKQSDTFLGLDDEEYTPSKRENEAKQS
jgi:hypothetical protein